jgi:hypothetical protein
MGAELLDVYGRTDRYHEPNRRFTEIYVVPDEVHSVIYSMGRGPSTEANRFSACQEIPRSVWNRKVYYRSHKRPPPVTILSHLDPVHVSTFHFFNTHLNSEPVLYSPLTFHVPTLMSHFRCTKISVQV